MATIRTVVNEPRRGCGYRKEGGLYLVSGEPMASCGKLPHELSVCPCCGAGIKPARGWTWIDPRPLFAEKQCIWLRRAVLDPNIEQALCPCVLDKANLPGRMGLLWIGEAFYKTPEELLREAAAQGLSRRISAIPNDFELGKTWVLLAHRKGMAKYCSHPRIVRQELDALSKEDVDGCPDCHGTGQVDAPAIFSAFRPTHIEYVVKGTETEEELDRMEARGISLVKLEWTVDKAGNHQLFSDVPPEAEE